MSLSRSSLVSTVLGVNCACEAMNVTAAGIGRDRIGVENDAGIGPDLDPAGVDRRQVDVHVDIGRVEDGEDLAARRKNLAHIGDAVLDAAVARRHERVVGDIDAVELHIVLGGIERMLGLADLGDCRVLRGDGTIHLLLALIEGLLRHIAFRHQELRAAKLLLCEKRLALLLLNRGVRFIERLLRLKNHGLGLPQRRLEILRIHQRHDLTRPYQVAFIGDELRDATGEFRIDVDLVGFETAIARGNARRQTGARVEPPVTRAGYGEHQHEKQRPALEPTPLVAPAFRRRHHGRYHGRQLHHGRLHGDAGRRLGAAGAHIDVVVVVFRHQRCPNPGSARWSFMLLLDPTGVPNQRNFVRARRGRS